MKIIIEYELGDSWNTESDLPPEIIHESMIEQIEANGFIDDVNNINITKIL